jgi:hypothetical protein
MAKRESEERNARRRRQRWREGLRMDPELRAVLREIQRRRRRRRWPGMPQIVVDMLCGTLGRERGGCPPRERRCTKRLGSRLCWGWRAEGSDRCRLHLREPEKT